MNPSASGWIPKFFTLVDKQQIIKNFSDEIVFYNSLKSTGFLFGLSTEIIVKKPLSKLNYTTEENTKINLFYSFLVTYFIKFPDADYKKAIDSILNFYKSIEKGKTSFLYKFSISQSLSDNLEHVLSSRLQESNSVLKKNDTTILPFSLLFLDVLAFKKFIISTNSIKLYEQELESTIINFCFLALKAKKEKDDFDFQIIQQIESSTEYLTNKNNQNQFYSIETIKRQFVFNELEKLFILDLCCLAVWNDKTLDESEYLFLESVTETLVISETKIKENIHFIKEFSKEHSKTISLFENSNPLNQLYKQATSTVKLLIVRNKNRLTNELLESGELVKLLGQSTLRELTTTEKDKVKEQLLDICKTVPSLTIFLIPGGSLLLPLLVKYIPSLLPSAFQDNRIQNKKEE